MSVFALVFVPQQNEKYYDLGGAAGFITTTLASLYYPSIKAGYANGRLLPLPPLSSFAPRQLLLSAALGVWITRLGSFLVHVSYDLRYCSTTSHNEERQRAIKAGGDSRFDEIKYQPVKFTFYWFMQGYLKSFTSLIVLMLAI